MGSRYRYLAVYSLTLALVAGAWLAHGLPRAHDFPAFWIVACCIVGCLFVWQFGVPVRRIGLISMERVPQIGLLLIFSPPVAASICAAASFLWPLLNRAYSQRSLTFAGIRALHNPAMTALILLTAGEVYQALGGRLPLMGLGLGDIGPLLALALVAQVVNVVTMTLFFHFDSRDVRAVITPVYALSDLIFVPAAVLAAVLYNGGNPLIFLLFVMVMIVFVLSFNSMRNVMTAVETERGPMARLFETRRALHGARSIDEVGERVLVETRALFRFDEFRLVLVERGQQLLDVRLHERRGERVRGRSMRVDVGLFSWVVEHARPLLVSNWSHAPDEVRRRAEITGRQTGSVVIVPLVDNAEVIGLVSVEHSEPGAYSQADLDLMRHLAEQIAPAVADARAFEDLEDYRKLLEERIADRTQELEKASAEKQRLIEVIRESSGKLARESLEDPLTGLANRRGFTQRLTAEMEVALALGEPLSLVLGDVDHFSAINDRLGHLLGDKVLCEIAALMRTQCKDTDLLARIGGEEFALLLPGMAQDDAVDFCEALRFAIEYHDWNTVQAESNVTASFGVVQWDGGADAAELLQAAEAQLDRAKRAGRNQIV